MGVHFPSAPNTPLPLGIYHSIARVRHYWLFSSSFTSLFAAIDELKETGQFSDIDLDTDEDEHSIEMHLPYVRKIFEGYVTSFYVQELMNNETTPPNQERHLHRAGPSWSHR
jgi:hypothetical protein